MERIKGTGGSIFGNGRRCKVASAFSAELTILQSRSESTSQRRTKSDTGKLDRYGPRFRATTPEPSRVMTERDVDIVPVFKGINQDTGFDRWWKAGYKQGRHKKVRVTLFRPIPCFLGRMTHWAELQW